MEGAAEDGEEERGKVLMDEIIITGYHGNEKGEG